VPQADWVARFAVALEVLRFSERAEMSATVRAIETRRLINVLADRLSTESMPMPDLNAVGDEFALAFDRWIVGLVDWLRAPTRE
jgi:hypothetical protein